MADVVQWKSRNPIFYNLFQINELIFTPLYNYHLNSNNFARTFWRTKFDISTRCCLSLAIQKSQHAWYLIFPSLPIKKKYTLCWKISTKSNSQSQRFPSLKFLWRQCSINLSSPGVLQSLSFKSTNNEEKLWNQFINNKKNYDWIWHHFAVFG